MTARIISHAELQFARDIREIERRISDPTCSAYEHSRMATAAMRRYYDALDAETKGSLRGRLEASGGGQADENGDEPGAVEESAARAD